MLTASPFLPAARCTPTSCNGDQYCAATGSCTNCDTIGAGRCTACTSATQCTACQPGWMGATCHQQSKQATQQRLLAMSSLQGECVAMCPVCVLSLVLVTTFHCPLHFHATGCKAMGAAGCTTGIIPGTMCCAGQGLSCIIPSGSSSGTCMKPPSLAASPVKSVSAVITSGVVTATVQLAAAPVSGTNGGGALGAMVLCCAWRGVQALHACCSSDKTGTTGAAKLCCSTLSSLAVITLYKVMLIVPGSSSPLYTLETPVTVRGSGTATVGLFDLVPDCHRSAHRRISYAFFAQTTLVYKEGVTTLFGGRKLPARGLCGRMFKVQLAAKNGAGYSGVATSTASYKMPACPGEEAVKGLGGTGTLFWQPPSHARASHPLLQLRASRQQSPAGVCRGKACCYAT